MTKTVLENRKDKDPSRPTYGSLMVIKTRDMTKEMMMKMKAMSRRKILL